MRPRTIVPLFVAVAAFGLTGQAKIGVMPGTNVTPIPLNCTLANTIPGLRVVLHNKTSDTIAAGRRVEWRINYVNNGARGNIKLPYDLEPERGFSPTILYSVNGAISCTAAVVSTGLAQ